MSNWSYTRIGAKDGKGIQSITEYYKLSVNTTEIFSASTISTWSTSISQPTSAKPYLLNAELVVYSDGTNEYKTPHVASRYVTDGQEGRGIAGITEYYLATSASSGVTRSTSGWTTTIQTMTSTKKYLWNYEETTYSDNLNPSYTEPCIIGVYGDKGDAGASSYSYVRYSANADGTDFTATPSSSTKYVGFYSGTSSTAPTDKASYTWTKFVGENGANGTSLTSKGNWASGTAYKVSEVVYYATNKTSYVCKKAHTSSSSILPTNTTYWTVLAAPGTDGINGTNGTNGQDATQYYMHFVYCDDTTSGINYNTSESRKYIGIYTDTEQADATTFAIASAKSGIVWSKAEGDKGDKGDTGAQGEPGAKGDKGDTGTRGTISFSGDEINFVKNGANAYTLTTASVGVTSNTMPVIVGDEYINPYTMDVWVCTTAGTVQSSSTARWTYKGRRKSDKDDTNTMRIFQDGIKLKFITKDSSATGSFTIEQGTDPFEETSELIKITRPATTSYVSGKFTPCYNAMKIDNSKAYRYACYFKHTNNACTTFFGATSWHNNGPDSGNPYVLSLAGAKVNSAYITNSSNASMGANQWYLIVGYVMPNGVTTAPSDAGVYNMTTKKKIATGTNFQWQPDISQFTHDGTMLGHRNNQAISQDYTCYLYDIRFDQTDGTEPTLDELLGISANPVNKGDYVSGTTYNKNDVVSYNGSSYICKVLSTTNEPTNTTDWNKLADKGNDAAQIGENLLKNSDFSNGISGYTGDTATFTPGTDFVYGNILNVKVSGAKRFYQGITGLFVSGKTYAYSFYAKADASVTVRPSRANVDNGTTHTVTTSWQKFTGKITATASSDALSFYFGNTTSTVSFALLKLEEGDTATAWCPNAIEYSGNSLLRVTTAPTAYTTTTGGFTPAYRISLATVRTQSGITNIRIGDIVAYSYNTYKIGYIDASYVYLASAVSIRGATGITGYSLQVSSDSLNFTQRRNGGANYEEFTITAKVLSGATVQTITGTPIISDLSGLTSSVSVSNNVATFTFKTTYNNTSPKGTVTISLESKGVTYTHDITVTSSKSGKYLGKAYYETDGIMATGVDESSKDLYGKLVYEYDATKTYNTGDVCWLWNPDNTDFDFYISNSDNNIGDDPLDDNFWDFEDSVGTTAYDVQIGDFITWAGAETNNRWRSFNYQYVCTGIDNGTLQYAWVQYTDDADTMTSLGDIMSLVDDASEQNEKAVEIVKRLVANEIFVNTLFSGQITVQNLIRSSDYVADTSGFCLKTENGVGKADLNEITIQGLTIKYNSNSKNITFGKNSQPTITYGYRNLSIGLACLSNNKGNENIAIGISALQHLNNASSLRNIAIGYNAGNHLKWGINNILIGSYAGANIGENDYVENNTFIGAEAGLNVLKGNGNIYLGNNRGFKKGSHNVFLSTPLPLSAELGGTQQISNWFGIGDRFIHMEFEAGTSIKQIIQILRNRHLYSYGYTISCFGWYNNSGITTITVAQSSISMSNPSQTVLTLSDSETTGSLAYNLSLSFPSKIAPSTNIKAIIPAGYYEAEEIFDLFSRYVPLNTYRNFSASVRVSTTGVYYTASRCYLTKSHSNANLWMIYFGSASYSQSYANAFDKPFSQHGYFVVYSNTSQGYKFSEYGLIVENDIILT